VADKPAFQVDTGTREIAGKALWVFLVTAVMFVPAKAEGLVPFQASPDRVLVVYNEEWTKDVDGSEPGQDSKEVAEYYVKMHTDPVTGKRPYLLGLKCIHGKHHLNDWVIHEESQDNKDGILFIVRAVGPGKGSGPGIQGTWRSFWSPRDKRSPGARWRCGFDPWRRERKRLLNQRLQGPRRGKDEDSLIPKSRRERVVVTGLTHTRFLQAPCG